MASTPPPRVSESAPQRAGTGEAVHEGSRFLLSSLRAALRLSVRFARLARGKARPLPSLLPPGRAKAHGARRSSGSLAVGHSGPPSLLESPGTFCAREPRCSFIRMFILFIQLF